MAKQSIVPFGPQHPVLPEPVHLDLVLEDEVVVKAVPSIGFVHRGLEKLVESKDYKEYVYIAERVCGICSFGHGMGYCQCLEKIMDVQIPPRAAYLRTIWMEMSRVHSHLLWLGLLADALGFESLFMQCWKLREKILDQFDATTGGRVIFSVNCIGGVLKDMDAAMLKAIADTADEMEKELRPIAEAFLRDYTVGTRLHELGVLTAEQARAMGAVGPTLRASGVPLDMRALGYAAYGELDFAPVTAKDGDSFARCEVRIREIFQPSARSRRGPSRCRSRATPGANTSCASNSRGARPSITSRPTAPSIWNGSACAPPPPATSRPCWNCSRAASLPTWRC